jgi:hypothetical protein
VSPHGRDAGAPEQKVARKSQLLMVIAAFRIIQNSSADNDAGAHAEERNKAGQYPEHCSLPWWFSFLQNVSMPRL